MQRTTDTPKRAYKRHKVRTPIERRATAMIRRGFDVPPSKYEDYMAYRRTGMTSAEIKEIMGLE